MNLFKTLQVPEAQRYWIRQARVPICFLPGGPKTAVNRDGATLIDLLVDNERIAAIEPAGAAASTDLPAIDLEAHHVWPTLIDMHAHLDKGHIVTRTENPDGSGGTPPIHIPFFFQAAILRFLLRPLLLIGILRRRLEEI